jgi:hypothetical protein
VPSKLPTGVGSMQVKSFIEDDKIAVNNLKFDAKLLS